MRVIAIKMPSALLLSYRELLVQLLTSCPPAKVMVNTGLHYGRERRLEVLILFITTCGAEHLQDLILLIREGDFCHDRLHSSSDCSAVRDRAKASLAVGPLLFLFYPQTKWRDLDETLNRMRRIAPCGQEKVITAAAMAGLFRGLPGGPVAGLLDRYPPEKMSYPFKRIR